MSIAVPIQIKNNLSSVQKVSYYEYRDDIQNFDMENYLNDKYESEKIKSVSDFLEMYKKIEDEDSKKPIFSQTAKFKKFPNHLKYYKYVKFTRDDDSKKKWSVLKPENETEKIILFINTCLNKITEQNAENIQKEWNDEFIKFDHPDLFELVFNSIFEKCINESKYLPLYILLAQTIWNNLEVHQLRYEVINLDEDYYVRFKYGEKEYGGDKLNEEKSLGPFACEKDCHNEAYLYMNFKRYFINKLEEKFKNRDITFTKERVDDNEFFEKKRQLIGLIDILLHLFKEKHIHMDILHIMILQFFHIHHNDFDPIEEIEVECIHKIIKYLCLNNFINKIKYQIFDEYVKIFNDYKSSNLQKTTRTEFFLNEMTQILENPVKYLNDNNLSTFNEKEVKITVNKFINQNHYKGLREYLDHNMINEEQRSISYEYVLNLLIEKKDTRKDWNIIFDNSQFTNIWINKMGKIIEKINDFALDIPDIGKRLEKMIKEMRIFSSNNEWFESIKKYNEENNDDSDEEWEKLNNDEEFAFAVRR